MTWLVAHVLTILAANLAVVHLGIVPVGFGLEAPAGVYFVGLAFLLRDYVQERLGILAVFLAIAIGAGLSAFFSADLALASAVAFGVSEVLDLLVYTPLRERQWFVAVVSSNIVGLVVDSVLFLMLAFGSLQFLAGQIVGKAWVTLLFVGAYALLFRNPSRLLVRSR